MASTSASTASPRQLIAEGEVSLFRLYVLRAMYLLLVIGLGAMIVPEILHHELTSRGVIPSLLGALWLLAFIGLRYPRNAAVAGVRVCLEGDLDGVLRAAAMVSRPISTDFR